MVSRVFVPPAGLPNQGLRKKLNAKHWLSTRRKLPQTRGVLPVSCELLGATEDTLKVYW